MAKEPEQKGEGHEEPAESEPSESEPEEIAADDRDAADEQDDDDTDDEESELASEPVKPPYGLYAVIGAAVLAGFGLWMWKRKSGAPATAPSASVSTSASNAPSTSTSTASIPTGPAAKLDPNETPAPANLELEVWFKDPNYVAKTVLPKITPPPAKPFDPTLGNFLKQGMPDDAQKDIDAVDFSKPVAYALLGDEEGVKLPEGDSTRFVWAAVVKDEGEAAKAVSAYATREKAAKEHSDALKADLWKGTKTGRYLGLVGKQVYLASDMRAIEEVAARLAAGVTYASAQKHDVVVRSPHSFLEGPLAKWAQQKWLDWSAPQLGGATTGPAKQLFDDVAASAKETFVGASEVEIDVDLGDTQSHATATLSVAPGSPFSQFLASFPATDASSILAAPRDALGVIVFDAPRSWIDTLKRFLVTPPPGAEGLIPPEDKQVVENVFNDIGGALDGEVLFANVADPPPDGGPGAKELRFKVKDAELAKRAVQGFASLFLPKQAVPNATTSAITVDGGAGEATEITIPTQPPAAPMPPVGFGWVLKGNYLYCVAGSNPKARVAKLAGSSDADHLAGDPDMVKRVGTMAPHEALALLLAPLRADAPLAKALFHIDPRPDAINLTLETSPTSVVVHADLDVDLTLLIIQLTTQPQFVPSGPVATATMPAPTVVKPTPGGTTPPPENTGTPHVVVPEAPTGFVLPIPKPGQGKSGGY